MNKKLICGLLSATILAGTFPMTALAADTALPKMKDGLDLRNQSTDISGTNWDWNADDLTLTLNGFRVTVPVFEMEEEPLFCLPDDSTVVIEGEDNLIETYSYHADVFYCEGELLICGNGKLKIVTGTYGTNAIFCKGGPLTIEDSAEITVDPEGHVIYIERAKGRRPIINILDEAKVSFPEEDADEHTVLVTHSSNVTPGDNWLNFSMEYDEFDETTWYYPQSAPQYINRKAFYPYIGHKDSGSTWLRWLVVYCADDWIFFDKIIINVDGEKYTKTFEYGEIERDNDYGDVWEYVDMSVSESDKALLKKIANSKKTVVRFEGDQYHYDKTITQNEKYGITDILTAYDYLND